MSSSFTQSSESQTRGTGIISGNSRGKTEIDWLKSYHTFDFGDYRNPSMRGFQSLRVLNEDWIAPGEGFPFHPHRDMEILTVLLSGTLEHEDSLGNHFYLKPGTVQRMRAGRGIVHSEKNPSPETPVHLYQIWIVPDTKGLEPGYEEKDLWSLDAADQWVLLADPNGAQGSLEIRQEARLYSAILTPGARLTWAPAPGDYPHLWLQVAQGQLTLEGDPLTGQATAGQTLEPGDAWVHSPRTTDAQGTPFTLRNPGNTPTQVLLFSLAEISH